jgi:hypothetical protein
VTVVDFKKAAEGINLIAIGAVLLACTFGQLPWAVWISIISLWPIALIAAGVDIIGNSTKQTWLRVLSSFIMLAALLYGAFVMTPGSWGFPIRVVNSGELTRIDAKEAHDSGVSGGSAKVQIGATKLTIEAGSDLAALTGDYRGGLKPTLTVTKSGSTADVRVDYQHQNAIVFFDGDPRQGLKLALDRSVAWDKLELDAGATQSSIDLTDLDVKEVTANVGAADTTFVFDRGRDVGAQVNGGMASVKLRVPKGANVTLHVQGLPVNVSVPSGFAESGSFGDRTLTYRGGGDGTIDVGVDGGMATVTVETY